MMKDDLQKAEYDWLMRLTQGNAKFMPSEIAVRLVELGYARQLLGGLGVTEDGHKRLLRGPSLL